MADSGRSGPVARNIRAEAGSIPSAVLSGFIATGAMTAVLMVAYSLAAVAGSPSPDAPVLSRWLWGLTHNVVTQRTQTSLPVAVGIHFISGIGWAVVYARWVHHRLSGPSWRRGVTFSLAPWVLSLIVFLPAVGGGILGLGLGAGPLPIVGNLVLHLVYGAVLGQLFSPWSERLQTETGEADTPEERIVLAYEERTIGIGIILGLVVGSLVGWVIPNFFALNSSVLVAAVAGGIIGSASGAFLASFVGLSGPKEQA